MNIIKLESWKDIPNYEGIYKVSNCGAILSVQRQALAKGGKFRIVPEKIMSFYTDQYGYIITGLCKNSLVKNKKVHRLVALAFIPNPHNKPSINHKDGNKTNNYVDNLEWVTPQENTDHANHLGLLNFINAPKGENSGSSILKNKDVLQIRDIYLTKNISKKEISKLFNVSYTAIYKIINRITWKHI